MSQQPASGQHRFPSQAEIEAASPTAATLRSWGVPWPPPNRWRRTLIRLHKAEMAGEPVEVPDWYIPFAERQEQQGLF